jgi:hypothetical protein
MLTVLVPPASLVHEQMKVNVDSFLPGCWRSRLIIRVGTRVHPSTLDWLRDHFSVSIIFLETIVDARHGVPSKTGNASFFRRDEGGSVVSISLSPHQFPRSYEL